MPDPHTTNPTKEEIERDFRHVVGILNSVSNIAQSRPAQSALDAAKRLQSLYQQGKLVP